MNVGEVCNREVVVSSKMSTLVEIAQLMRQYHVGTVVITQKDRQFNIPIGIVTDRDIVLQIVAPQLPLDAYCAGDVMSDEIHTISERAEVWSALQIMREQGIRRLPVVNQNQHLVGILSADDVLEILVEEFGDIVNLVAREQKQEIRTRTVP